MSFEKLLFHTLLVVGTYHQNAWVERHFFKANGKYIIFNKSKITFNQLLFVPKYFALYGYFIKKGLYALS